MTRAHGEPRFGSGHIPGLLACADVPILEGMEVIKDHPNENNRGFLFRAC